jgi:hypothetical protein
VRRAGSRSSRGLRARLAPALRLRKLLRLPVALGVGDDCPVLGSWRNHGRSDANGLRSRIGGRYSHSARRCLLSSLRPKRRDAMFSMGRGCRCNCGWKGKTDLAGYKAAIDVDMWVPSKLLSCMRLIKTSSGWTLSRFTQLAMATMAADTRSVILPPGEGGDHILTSLLFLLVQLSAFQRSRVEKYPSPCGYLLTRLPRVKG